MVSVPKVVSSRLDMVLDVEPWNLFLHLFHLCLQCTVCAVSEMFTL